MSEMTMEIEKKEAETPVAIERKRARRTFSPRVDIYSFGDEVFVVANMPGVNEEGVDITLEKNLLTIRGKVEDQTPVGYEPIYAEYRVGDYERTFTLSDGIDRDKIEASLKNGVLRLTLTKSEVAKARKITVRSES